MFSLHIVFKVLLWLVLVYPLALAYEYFFGAQFANLRVAFPLTRWRRLPGATSITSLQEAHELARPLTRRAKGPKVGLVPGANPGEAGVWAYLVGEQEGELLQRVEGAIAHGVRTGKRGKLDPATDEAPSDSASRLRGYRED